MRSYYTSIFRISLMLMSVCLINMSLQAQDKTVYSKSKMDMETGDCAEKLNKEQLLLKEFPHTSFILDLNKNKLQMIQGQDIKTFIFHLDNKKMSLTRAGEDREISMDLTYENGLPVLRFKDHADDCFIYVVIFEK